MYPDYHAVCGGLACSAAQSPTLYRSPISTVPFRPVVLTHKHVDSWLLVTNVSPPVASAPRSVCQQQSCMLSRCRFLQRLPFPVKLQAIDQSLNSISAQEQVIPLQDAINIGACCWQHIYPWQIRGCSPQVIPVQTKNSAPSASLQPFVCIHPACLGYAIAQHKERDLYPGITQRHPQHAGCMQKGYHPPSTPSLALSIIRTDRLGLPLYSTSSLS